MKGTAIGAGRVMLVTALVLILPVVLCEQMLYAQIMSPPTIDSRDTRTFEDTRGQDPRQNPGPVPPSAIELMKKLNEGKIPDSTDESESSKGHSENPKPGDTKPHTAPSGDK